METVAPTAPKAHPPRERYRTDRTYDDRSATQKPKNPPPRRERSRRDERRRERSPSARHRVRRSPSATRWRRERDPQPERNSRWSPSEEPTTSVHNRRVGTEELLRQFRQGEAGRGEFANFTREKYWQAAALFVDAGYTSVDCVRQMQEQARQYFLTDLRKGAPRERHFVTFALSWTSSICS